MMFDEDDRGDWEYDRWVDDELDRRWEEQRRAERREREKSGKSRPSNSEQD